MEVHHHSHTSRKKWTHYLWEFLMLFLAVTLGFFVENQREHYVEHQREKQYMRSMIEDLALDTAEYNYRLKFISEVLLPVLDTAQEIIYNRENSPDYIRELYDYVPRCPRFLEVYIEDRTMSQLKSSGNLRLIRNKAITDSLATYWKIIDIINNTLIRGYELTRLEVKDISSSLFNFKYFKENHPYSELKTDVQLKLNSDNKQEMIKMANFISNLYHQANSPIRGRIADAKGKATELIRLIREEYNIK